MALFWKWHSLLRYKKFSCLKDKKPNQEKRVLLTNNVTQEQFEFILTDYIHLIKFKEGGRRGGVSEYLLTSFSLNSFLPNTFKLFQPRKNKSSRAVADLLFSKNFLNYGFPKLVINDQGREFVIKLFQCTEKLAERKSLKTTHYHLMDKVISERMNRTVINMLKTLTEIRNLIGKITTKKKAFNVFIYQ